MQGLQRQPASVRQPESVGLPEEVMRAAEVADRLRLPMLPGSRSLNLSNSAAIAVYEAWRQQEFEAGV